MPALLQRLFPRIAVNRGPEQFPGVKLGALLIEGEEKIQALLKEKLNRHGITTVPYKEESSYRFSFWTLENPGIPIRQGVRLILRSPDDEIIGDTFSTLPFYSEDAFTSYVSQWIVGCLKQAQSPRS